MRRFKNESGFFIRAIILSILLLPNAAAAEDGGSAGRCLCNDLKGNKRWEAAVTIKPMEEKNMHVYIEEGSGVHSGFDGQVRWKTEAEFIADANNIIPMRMKKTFVSPAGAVLFEGLQEFDRAKGEVTCIKRWPASGKVVRKTLRYKGDVVNDCLLGLYTQRYLKNGERKKTYYLVTNDPNIYKITARFESEEAIPINGKAINSYKIHLKPDAGILGIFAGLLPQTYIWHRAGGNFDWLKYKGAEDTLNSPEVEMETLDNID